MRFTWISSCPCAHTCPDLQQGHSSTWNSICNKYHCDTAIFLFLQLHVHMSNHMYTIWRYLCKSLYKLRYCCWLQMPSSLRVSSIFDPQIFISEVNFLLDRGTLKRVDSTVQNKRFNIFPLS